MDTFEERGQKFARASEYLYRCIDDALAGLDCYKNDPREVFLTVTRERLESVWCKLQEIQPYKMPNGFCQSDFTQSKGAPHDQ